MIEIYDSASASEWMEAQPKHVGVYLASRAALRAFPAVYLVRQEIEASDSFDASMLSEVLLPTLFGLTFAASASTRSAQQEDETYEASMMLSSVLDYWSGQTSTSPTHFTCYGDDSATDAIMAVGSAVSCCDEYGGSGAGCIQRAAGAASRAVSFQAQRNGLSTEDVVQRRQAAVEAMYEAASWDANDASKDWSALWPSGVQRPEEMVEIWNAFKAFMSKKPEIWGFWIEWYEALLLGQAVSWGLMYDITSKIPDEEWDPQVGPAKVAERIKSLAG